MGFLTGGISFAQQSVLNQQHLFANPHAHFKYAYFVGLLSEAAAKGFFEIRQRYS